MEKRVEELSDALRFLAEMSSYAIDHLEPAWAAKNRSDFARAIEDANNALSE